MLVALVGPSGSGKTTLSKNIYEWASNTLPLLSYTTRAPRSTDIKGEYAYVSATEFESLEKAGAFAWVAGHYGNRYGTRTEDVRLALDDLERIHVAILIVDVVTTLRRLASASAGELCFIYLLIDDEEELRRRMGAEAGRTGIDERLAAAKVENAKAQKLGNLLHTIDATLPPEEVTERAVRIINLFANSA